MNFSFYDASSIVTPKPPPESLVLDVVLGKYFIIVPSPLHSPLGEGE